MSWLTSGVFFFFFWNHKHPLVSFQNYFSKNTPFERRRKKKQTSEVALSAFMSVQWYFSGSVNRDEREECEAVCRFLCFIKDAQIRHLRPALHCLKNLFSYQTNYPTKWQALSLPKSWRLFFSDSVAGFDPWKRSTFKELSNYWDWQIAVLKTWQL